jgi:putative ABC transport system permease protein
MLTSFNRLRGVNLGFVAENLVIVGVALPQARYGREAQISFYQQLYERLTIGIQDQPGTRAALAFPSPFSGANSAASYEIDGRPARSRQERSVAQLSAVSPGYFQTMGIPVLKGRDLSFSDSSKGPNVAIINRLMAEREWPNEDPVGQRLILGGDRDDPDSRITVVGVVADSKRQDLQAETEPTAYLPLTQFTLPFMSVVIRTTAGAAGAANAVRTAVRSLDPDLPLEDVESIEHVLGRATGQPRFRATLVAAFAAAALLLAAIGLYGLISYTVAQRIPEIGVRLALGATPAQVLRLVVAQAMRLSLIGVAFGLAGAVAVGRVIRGLLFSISATDPIVYASLALFLLTIAAFACYVPARRAMRVDPMTALRAE